MAIDSTNMEVNIMATMAHPAPLCLFARSEGKTALMIPEDGFGYRLKTFGLFSGRQVNSFRQDVSKKVACILSSVKGSLQGDGLAVELAKHLLLKVKSQLSELLSFLSDWHEELVEQCDYTSDTAWTFIGFAVRCIMDHLVQPRMEVAAVTSLSLNDSKALVIWAVLQVHIRLNEIIDANFKSHQVVTTAMSNFVMKTRVDRSQVDALGSKVVEAVKVASVSDKKATTLEADLKSVKQMHGNKISALEKKVAGKT